MDFRFDYSDTARMRAGTRLNGRAARYAALLWLAFGLCTLGCGGGETPAWASLERAITGGEIAAPGAFPAIVFLDVACTGVLVAEDTLVYAAHCGTHATRAYFGDGLRVELNPASQTIAVEAPAQQTAAIGFCRAHPEAFIGGPFDVAFCRLAEPASVGREQLPAPLASCERQALREGLPVTLVGYGLEPASGTVGVKRVVETPLAEAGSVLVAGDTQRGSCGGDSGGPLFVRTDDLNPSWPPQWRLAGVLSSGNATEVCGAGRYVDSSAAIEWLEAESRRDVSPCSDAAGNWAPTPRCRFPLLGADAVEGAAVAASTCGPSHEAAVSDETPPEFLEARVENRSANDGGIRLDVVAELFDAGWGVERVTLAVLSADGAELSSDYSEVPPFAFRELSLPPEAQRLQLTARDHAGLSASVELAVREPAETSCSASGAPGITPSARGMWLLIVSMGWFGLRRRRGRA